MFMKSHIAIAVTLFALCGASCRSQKSSSELRPAAASYPPSSSAAATLTSPSTAPSAASSTATTRPLTAPSAVGEINTRIDANNNLVLEVTVEHLPLPGNLGPALTTYVVWIRPRAGGPYQNVGQLVMGPKRSGRLDTKTAFDDVDLVVTAETSAGVREPSQFIVLEGTARRP
jgi:hypothetical protein